MQISSEIMFICSPYIYIYIYIVIHRQTVSFYRTIDPQDAIYFFFFFHHTTCGSTCDTLASSAAIQGDNTVSIAQGGTATPGATEQLLPLDRVFKKNLCIHKIN